MRGRKPIPTHLKLVRGSKRAGKSTGEPRPVGALFYPPDWFTEPQKEVWAYAIQHAPDGLLKKLDRDALAIWTVAQDIWRRAIEAQAAIDAGNKLPLLTKTPNGMAQQSPYVGIISKQAQIILKAGAELGFSPSSRSRINVSPEEGEEELEALIGSR